MAPMECTICASRWFSARYHGRLDPADAHCDRCGGPLVRVDEEPVVRSAAAVATAPTVEFDRIRPGDTP